MALVKFPGPQSASLPDPPDDEEESGVGKMSFLEHLDEFRKRVINSLIGVCVGIAASAFFLDPLYTCLTGPAVRTLPLGPEGQPGQLIYNQPTEAFTLRLEIALIAGALLAAPFIMYQVWMFIAPGLYSNEKKFVI